MTGNYDLPDLFVISLQEHLLVLHPQGSVFTSGKFNLHFFPSLCGQIRYSLEYLFPSSADGEIPLDLIFGDELDLNVMQMPIYVLGSYGLENKSRFPNTKTIREFLNERFNFDIDDVADSSPFKW